MESYQQIKLKNERSQIFAQTQSQETLNSSYKQQFSDIKSAAQQNLKKMILNNKNATGKQKFAYVPASRGFIEVIGFENNQVKQEPVKKKKESIFVPQFDDINATQRKLLDVYGIVVDPSFRYNDQQEKQEMPKRSRSAVRSTSDIRKHLQVPLKAYESENHKERFFQSLHQSQVFGDPQQQQIVSETWQETNKKETQKRVQHQNEKNYSSLFGREFDKPVVSQQKEIKQNPLISHISD